MHKKDESPKEELKEQKAPPKEVYPPLPPSLTTEEIKELTRECFSS